MCLLGAFVSRDICFKWSLGLVITLVAEWIETYGNHHCRIFRSSYTKLAWVGFEPTTTEFRPDALTDWAIRPWVQLALGSNFVQLLQFHLFVQCSRFISVCTFVSRHIYFKRSFGQVIALIGNTNHVSIYIFIRKGKEYQNLSTIKHV